MKWLKPRDEHIVYEALSAIADGRFELTDETTGKCTSTSKGKFYTITYDGDSKEIMSNDNMAYFRGEVSYPMVAMLLVKGECSYDKSILEHLKNIAWKAINQKNKNDYMKSVDQVLKDLEEQKVDVNLIKNEVKKIFEFILAIELSYLGNKTFPPKAY